MNPNDYYLEALDRQATAILHATVELDKARNDDFKVLQAEVRLGSVIDAYHRLLSEAPAVVVRFHVTHMNGA